MTTPVTIYEPTRYDFTVMRGDDWGPFTIAVTDDTGAPVDISGSLFYLTVRTSLPASTVTSDADASFQKIVTVSATPPNLSTAIGFTHTESYALDGDYRYDLQWVDSTKVVTTLIYGIVSFLRDVTRTAPTP